MTALIDLFEEYAEQSVAALGLEEKKFSIGGFGVRLRFAGQRWSGILTKALDHLQTDQPAEPSRRQLTISILDGSLPQRNPLLRTYLQALPERWWEYTGPRGELLHLHGGSVLAFYHPGPDMLTIVDVEADLGFLWKRDLSPLPYYEAGSPMRALLHGWMRKQGVQFVHGGAVGTESGGVLLAGKGGSGKSTSVLACFDSCLKYASDDYCMVGSPDSKHWEVYSLYNTAKLTGDSDLAKFSGLAKHVWNPHREPLEKATIFLNEAFPQKLIPQFPLRAILVPVITGQIDTRIEPCGDGVALMALGPSSLAQLPASGPQDLHAIAQVVRSSPCFRMNLGTDLTQIPGAIGELLSRLSQ
jgi:hypothetical protein